MQTYCPCKSGSEGASFGNDPSHLLVKSDSICVHVLLYNAAKALYACVFVTPPMPLYLCFTAVTPVCLVLHSSLWSHMSVHSSDCRAGERGTFRHMDLPFVYNQLGRGVTSEPTALPLVTVLPP